MISLNFSQAEQELMQSLFSNQKDYYDIFKIPKKKRGQFTEIIAPNEEYKNLQRKIYNSIYGQLPNHPSSFAWTENRDRQKCLIPHVGKDWVMESDVKNYFKNIRTFHLLPLVQLIKTNIGYNDLINILTIQDNNGIRFLPQGFVTSPIFANAVRYNLDVALHNYIADKDIEITFYGDNIISSSNNVEQLVELQSVIKDLYNNEGFSVEKQPIKPHYYNQEILGFLINEKFNMSHKYYKKLLSSVIDSINSPTKLISLSLQGKINLLKLNDNPRDYKYITNFIKNNGGILEKIETT